MKRIILSTIAGLVVVAGILATSVSADAAATPWINDLAYGSAGGGFYWDTASGQVWTAERGWHLFSPQPPRTVAPLWTNHLSYGSAGGGFYWDPTSNQVWTAERGWHYFDPRPNGTVQPPTPSPTKPGAKTFGDGTFIVGQDIPPGTYRTRTAADGCYWERLSGFSGKLSDVIANDFTDFVSVVTIAPTDQGFKSDDCGIWTNDLSSITSSPTAPFGPGTLIVGTDIGPGTWRAPGGGSCYWERLSGFSGKLADVISNDYGGINPVVTIAASDKGFHSDDCGQWTKIS